jgi:hypothetical protein
MKKFLFVLTVIAIILLVWFKLKKPNPGGSFPPDQSAETNQPSRQPPSADQPVPVAVPQPEANVLPPDAFNALTATNLDQWKAAMKRLKSSDIFYQNTEMWHMEQTNRTTGTTVLLVKGTQIVQYQAAAIDVSAKKPGGDVILVQMQTPNMNIDETRGLGVQLCNIMEVDPKDFQAWCDKAGNHWMEAPLYATNHYYGFAINRTYDNEKPWFINFVIGQQ